MSRASAMRSGPPSSRSRGPTCSPFRSPSSCRWSSASTESGSPRPAPAQRLKLNATKGTIMNTENRRRAIRAYKDRKLVMGIYAIRCAASGQVWAGQSRTLDTIENRLWFSLRLGGHPNADLQSAFVQHGQEALTFEPLQQLPDEATA